MPNDLETYRQTLLDLYLRLPDTPRRVSRHDGQSSVRDERNTILLRSNQVSVKLAATAAALPPIGCMPA